MTQPEQTPDPYCICGGGADHDDDCPRWLPDPEVIDGPVPADTRSVRAALRSVRPPNMGPSTEPRLDHWDAHKARAGDPVVGAYETEDDDA